MRQHWKQSLLDLAKSNNMCVDNYKALIDCNNKQDAVSLYKRTIDWALKRNYPAIEFLRQEFSDCEDLGLFVDKEFNGELLDNYQCYVFHNCSGHILVDLNAEKKIIPMLYFANGTNMTISRANSAHSLPIKVPLYIYGKNSIKVRDDDDIIFKRYIGDVL